MQPIGARALSSASAAQVFRPGRVTGREVHSRAVSASGLASLSAAFVARLGEGANRADAASLQEALHGILAAAREAWPGVELDAEEFASELGRRSAGADPTATLSRLCATDLFIACAVARGVPGALAAFERRFFPDIARTVAAVDRSPAFAAEVQQILRERLFLGGAGEPGIAQYAGRGSLPAWLRISAMRVAGRLREGTDRETDLERLDKLSDRALDGAQSDPEVEHLKATYRPQFRQAFHDALGAISARERNVLRLHTLDRLTGEQIARFYGVTQPTCSRWLSHARQTLHERTRDLLRQRLGLSGSQLDSLAGLVLSQLELSLPRVLRE